MFVAASDVENMSVIDLLGVKRGRSVMCFDAVGASGRALENEIFRRGS